MIIIEEPDMELKFNPCASCGKSKVVKVGDYCRACALIPDLPASEHEYIILSRATLDIAAEKSGMAREFLAAKTDRAFENYQHYVIYLAKDEWRDITISDTFYIPVVMKNLFKKVEG